MTVGEYCNRDVVIVSRQDSVKDVVHLMRQHHVGNVVVMESNDANAKPVGILTDRDIVIELLADDVDLSSVNVGDVMSHDLLVATENMSVLDALQQMQNKAVRRLPVVSNDGVLLGILSADDMLEILGEQISLLINLIKREQKKESRVRK